MIGRFAKERELLQGLRKVVGAEALKWLMSNVGARGESSRRVGQCRYLDQVLAWLTFEHVAALRES